MVIDNLKLANVAVLLHHLEELDDDLGRGANEHLLLSQTKGKKMVTLSHSYTQIKTSPYLALAARLGVVDALEAVAKNADADHV